MGVGREEWMRGEEEKKEGRADGKMGRGLEWMKKGRGGAKEMVEEKRRK